MNKKNVIMLVCDGLPYYMVNKQLGTTKCMPFVNSLHNNSLWCNRAYSQGPYTEAGILGLCYGHNPLEEGGYFYGMQNWNGSIYKSFYDSGYQILTSYFGSYIPPETMEKGKYVYATNYGNPMFSRYIKGKLDYYKTIFESDGLCENDYVVLVRLIRKHFETMLKFRNINNFENDITGEYGVFCKKDKKNSDLVNTWKKKVEDEFSIYKTNPTKYINNIFEKYDRHFITNDCNISHASMKKEIEEQRLYVKKKYKEVFNSIKVINCLQMFRNKHGLKEEMLLLLRSLGNRDNRKKLIELLYRAWQSFFSFDISKMCGEKINQISNSAKAFARIFIKWDQKRNKKDPFFVYFHFDEFHRPVSFYSHDIEDKRLIDEEFGIIKSVIKQATHGYEGNLYFDLAARYIDNCIKEIFEYLQRTNQIDNTIVVITADHGSSNTGKKVRYTLTNNFYDEQYHIPCIIYGMGCTGEIDTFINIKDIPYTILSECGIDIPASFSGQSIMDGKRDNTFVQYFGTGVPDYERKAMLYQYRNEQVSYVVSGKLNDISSLKIIEYYDLKNDPDEIYNIVDTLSMNEKERMVNKHIVEYEDIKNNYRKWLHSNESY